MSLLVITLISLSSVTATDLNNDSTLNGEVGVIDEELMADDDIGGNVLKTEEISQDNALSVDENELMSFRFLNDEIQSSVDELVLKNDYMYNDTYDGEFMNGIVINKSNFVIDGNGHSINGGSLANIFNITGNNVTLKNINFVDALSIGNAAAATFNGNGTVLNCNFTHISSNLDGGALYFNGTGIVENCNFNVNTAGQNGGAVYFNSTGFVKNSTFIQNNANNFAGVVYFSDDGFVDRSNFFGNEAALRAGAIYFAKRGTVKYSSFILNTAGEYAGAIYFNGTGNVDHCNFNVSRSDYAGAIYCVGEGIVTSTTFRLNTAEHSAGAICFDANATVENCSFDKNQVKYGTGAVLFRENATVKNSKFFNNSANSEGGAISIGVNGTIDSCSFDNNTGVKGGAICFTYAGFVNNSSFTNNKATQVGGGAISAMNYPLTVANSLFLNNKAKSTFVTYLGNFNFRFSGSESFIHAIYAQECIFVNVTYWNGNVVNSDDVTPLRYSLPGIEVIVEVYDSGNSLVDNVTLVTDNECMVYYHPFHLDDGEYTLKAYHADDSYYYRSNEATSSFSLKRNSTSVEINIKDNAEFNYGDCNIGFTVVNSTEVRVLITDKSGLILVNETTNKNNIAVNFGPGDYNITVYNAGNTSHAPSKDSKLFKISKATATIVASNKAYVINYGGKYAITLKDAHGNVLSGQTVTFTLNGKSIGSAVTDANGVATITLTAKILKAAKAGKRNLIIRFDTNNYQVSKTVKITISKEKTKIAAKKITFKKSKKVKKYTMTLKNSKGKAVKKVWVTLKVKGKTYKAKTNAKGKAIFKIKKLTKKGTFKATIKFKGNAYYKAVTKKVKIKIK